MPGGPWPQALRRSSAASSPRIDWDVPVLLRSDPSPRQVASRLLARCVEDHSSEPHPLKEIGGSVFHSHGLPRAAGFVTTLPSKLVLESLLVVPWILEICE